jgi:glycosyltransferase involved in cell wall biosynthesis
MKIALVYDRINKFGGAERLLLALHRLYPNSPIFTLVHEPKTSKWASHIKVIPTFLNKVPFLRTRHEWLAPLAPLAFETLNLSSFDIIISITSSDAKSILTKPNQLHICYCLTPTRYFWSGEAEYLTDKKLKLIPTFLKNYFRTVDLLTSSRPDEYIAISQEVKKRIKDYYHRQSTVVYPPIEEQFYSNSSVKSSDRKSYLLVSRLVPYKKTALAISAFNKLNRSLIIVGEGSEMESLKRQAGTHISFAGKINDKRLIEYYCHAKAVIFPQDEDFGLVPLEAQACGTPVIAYGKGGALETIIPGKTGLFFEKQTEESLTKAILEFENLKINPQDCVQNAKRFSDQNFSSDFSDSVNSLWQKHLKRQRV